MKVLDVEFLRSAAAAADLPRDPAPQVALLGRSNVGKSSLINALTRTKAARTSAAPGKTRLLNLYLVHLAGFTPERLYLVDLPGYGYARGGTKSASAFDALVSEYFAHPGRRVPDTGSRRLRDAAYGPSAALLIVDARHPGLSADVAALAWLHAQQRPAGVVVSKIDKLSRSERVYAEKAWADALNVPILPVSAVTGEGLNELWKRISKLLSAPSGPSGPTAPSGRNEPNGRTGPNGTTGATGPSASSARSAATARSGRAGPSAGTTSRSSTSRR